MALSTLETLDWCVYMVVKLHAHLNKHLLSVKFSWREHCCSRFYFNAVNSFNMFLRVQLSPKKTWEGFIGGAFFTVIFGWFVSAYISACWVSICALVSVRRAHHSFHSFLYFSVYLFSSGSFAYLSVLSDVTGPFPPNVILLICPLAIAYFCQVMRCGVIITFSRRACASSRCKSRSWDQKSRLINFLMHYSLLWWITIKPPIAAMARCAQLRSFIKNLIELFTSKLNLC